MKENRIKHTAHFLLSKFLNSKKSLQYSELTGNSISILHYIFSVMDMNFNQHGREVCDKSNAQIAAYSRTSLNTVKRSIIYFVKCGFLKIQERQPRKPIVFGIGDLISARAMVAYVYPQADNDIAHHGLSTRAMVGQDIAYGEPLVTDNSCKTEQSTLPEILSTKNTNTTYKLLPSSSFIPTDFNLDEKTLAEVKKMGYSRDEIEHIKKIFVRYFTQGDGSKIYSADWQEKCITWFSRERSRPGFLVNHVQEPYSAVNRMPFHVAMG